MIKLDFRKNKWAKYGVASFIAWVYLAFTVGWLFVIPLTVAVFMVYGLIVLMRERKHRITVSVKPTEAMKAIARREEELKRDKERLLYEEFHNGTKR